jgi:phage-related baseplate assembly protein
VSLAKKLNLKEGARLRVIGRPKAVELGDVTVTSLANVKDVLVFVARLADVETLCAPVIDSARADRLAWAAYPKAGQLGTDLDRNVLCKALEKEGIQPVRQIALDDVWSALRFRPR